jgi:hypothetical protein
VRFVDVKDGGLCESVVVVKAVGIGWMRLAGWCVGKITAALEGFYNKNSWIVLSGADSHASQSHDKAPS